MMGARLSPTGSGGLFGALRRVGPSAPSGRRGGRRGAWRRTQLRRGLAALLAGAAVWSAITAFAPAQPPSATAVAAAADLAAGHRLDADDLTLVPVDPATAPGSRLGDVAAAVGQTLAAPLERGEVLTAARLRPSSGLAQLPLGERALHVPVADRGSVALVRPGDRVDVVSVESGQTVGSGLLVVSIDTPGQSGGFGGGDDTPAGVVLAVPPGDVGRIVSAAVGGVAGGVQLAVRPDPARR